MNTESNLAQRNMAYARFVGRVREAMDSLPAVAAIAAIDTADQELRNALADLGIVTGAVQV